MKCVCNNKVGWGERRPKKEQERQPTERSARAEFQGAAQRGKTLEGRNSERQQLQGHQCDPGQREGSDKREHEIKQRRRGFPHPLCRVLAGGS